MSEQHADCLGGQAVAPSGLTPEPVTNELSPLLIPPQEAYFRTHFDLDDVALQLITSGWHRLVVTAPDRVFVFPRNHLKVPMIEREAAVLRATELDFAPRLLGFHCDDRISPHPFLALTRIQGRSYDHVEASFSYAEVGRCLEGLGRRIGQLHRVTISPELSAAPDWAEAGRLSREWTHPDAVRGVLRAAADRLALHLEKVPVDLWAQALAPIAALERTTVHGEVSDGQFLIDERQHVTGLVDWNALHVDHPLRDLDFGLGGYRICRAEFASRWIGLRRRIWEGYTAARGVPLPDWRSVNLLWCLVDALTALDVGIPGSATLPAAVNDLAQATRDLS